MGTLTIPVEIGSWDRTEFETVDALVDSGATYTFIPTSLLTKLGVIPSESMVLEMADGTVIEREMAWAYVRLDGRLAPTIVVFADDNAAPLLGAFTLEAFRLGIDPVNARLMPVTARI